LDDPYGSQSSSPVTPLDLRRYRAERLLRKDFAGLRAKVLAVVRSQLGSKGITLDPADLDACYSQAWHGLYATLLDGEAVESPSAWLVLVTFRRAIDEHRSKRRVVVLEGEDRRLYPRESDASAQDLAAALDDRVRLRHLFEGMRASLSPREREAASLCYLQGLSRAQAAERMGVSEARMRKLMEGAGAGRPGVAGKLGELLETIKLGGWCEQQSSLMRAYAFGILDPEGERHARAVAHCRECPACRAHVASLRGLASVLPLPLLPKLASGGSVKANAGAKGSSSLSSSLTAKLAVTAVVVLGAGYGVLGSRAPASAPARRPTARPVGVIKALPHTTRAPAHAPRSTRRHIRRSLRTPMHSVNKARAIGRASLDEFGPERVAGQPLPVRSTPNRGGEFGPE
jgi:RNA polymerase sigma factor (sigma-70 family)